MRVIGGCCNDKHGWLNKLSHSARQHTFLVRLAGICKMEIAILCQRRCSTSMLWTWWMVPQRCGAAPVRAGLDQNRSGSLTLSTVARPDGGGPNHHRCKPATPDDSARVTRCSQPQPPALMPSAGQATLAALETASLRAAARGQWQGQHEAGQIVVGFETGTPTHAQSRLVCAGRVDSQGPAPVFRHGRFLNAPLFAARTSTFCHARRWSCPAWCQTQHLHPDSVSE